MDPDGFEQLYHFINNALGQRLSAKFSADATSGKSPLTVSFKDESLGNVLQYMWDFGDGDKSTVPNPVHIFQKPGEYSVRLTLSNEEENIHKRKKILFLFFPVSSPKPGSVSMPTQAKHRSRGYSPIPHPVTQSIIHGTLAMAALRIHRILPISMKNPENIPLH